MSVLYCRLGFINCFAVDVVIVTDFFALSTNYLHRTNPNKKGRFVDNVDKSVDKKKTTV